MIGGEWKRAKGATKSPLGEFLIERPPLAAGSCLSLLFFQFSLTAYAAAGETSRAIRLALLISATRRS